MAHQAQRDQLTFERDFFADPTRRAAHARLMREVFAIDVEKRNAAVGSDPSWVPFGLFDESGGCAASVEATVIPVMTDSVLVPMTAIRLAAVGPAWRGLGLFRDVMIAALAWCETAAGGPTLLYTADHALYARFGFRPVAQFKRFGPAPAPIARRPSRPLDPRDPRDSALLRRLLANRAPVSAHCSLVGAASLFWTHILDAEDTRLVYVPGLDTIVAYEIEDAFIVLVDVVAPFIPAMADILSALPARAAVTALFPTDRLDWAGGPAPEDTGLMLRGPMPEAMRRPFMLPPTTEF